jgi:threonine/homoserine efflux transporter RhtA
VLLHVQLLLRAWLAFALVVRACAGAPLYVRRRGTPVDV